ncbi:MAG: hypothetical protein ISS28_07435 [Candidatus Cloacimonetes bacterium]|nr:hypothetical protein [Candidatus Cloacimonadota bacterium]
MAIRQDELLKLESDANVLVNNIKSLHETVGSYKTAKDSLESINEQLKNFISSTKELSQESHKIIGKLNEIGSTKILEQIEDVSKKIEEESDQVKNKLSVFEELIGNIKNKSDKTFIFIVSGLSLISILQILNLVLR